MQWFSKLLIFGNLIRKLTPGIVIESPFDCATIHTIYSCNYQFPIPLSSKEKWSETVARTKPEVQKTGALPENYLTWGCVPKFPHNLWLRFDNNQTRIVRAQCSVINGGLLPRHWKDWASIPKRIIWFADIQIFAHDPCLKPINIVFSPW